MADSEMEIYFSFCSVLVDLDNNPMAWIGIANESKIIEPVYYYSQNSNLAIQDESVSNAVRTLIDTNFLTPDRIQNHNILNEDVLKHLKIEKTELISIFSLPVFINSEIYGYIFIGNNKSREFDDKENDLMNNISKTLGLGLSLLKEKSQKIVLQSALENEKNELRLTLSSISDGVISANTNGHIIY